MPPKKPGKPGKAKNPNRMLKTRVKTAKGRKLSSTLWLERQLNDPYVARSKQDGYRSRAAYKLLEINEKYPFLSKGKVVVDLGAAPGGWMQVAVQKVKAGEPEGGLVIGMDLLAIEPITHTHAIQCDFLSNEALTLLDEALQGKKVDVVLSDMAAASCGHRQTDHLRIMALCEAALEFALAQLAPGGVFLSKILRGGTEAELLKQLKQHFASVKHIKPPASRADSSEMYVIAKGFRKHG